MCTQNLHTNHYELSLCSCFCLYVIVIYFNFDRIIIISAYDTGPERVSAPAPAAAVNSLIRDVRATNVHLYMDTSHLYIWIHPCPRHASMSPSSECRVLQCKRTPCIVCRHSAGIRYTRLYVALTTLGASPSTCRLPAARALSPGSAIR